MKVVVLTSSRADYGIYRPLLSKLDNDSFFELRIVAFGTHLSPFFGYTIDHIYADGYQNVDKVESLIQGDTADAIGTAMALTMQKFNAYWTTNKADIDLVICLGDRYEMFAAIASSIPHNIPIAHLHGGETTLGAIDNKFRHMLSLSASMHFTSTETYAERVAEIVGSANNIHNVGTLGLDNLITEEFYSISEFESQFEIDLGIDTILMTFHPETVKSDLNKEYALEIAKAFKEIDDIQLVITMPNADTSGNIIREVFTDLEKNRAKTILVENFGTRGYFSCMKHSSMMIGNTSSGIVEAASFDKYVINLGDRQKGRLQSDNTFDCKIVAEDIVEMVRQTIRKGSYNGPSIYRRNNSSTADAIISILKQKKN